MEFLKKIRLVSAAQRMAEEAMYASVVGELARGIRREGLWAKALVEANGNETAAKAIYLKLRVQAMRDDGAVGQAISEAKAEAEAEAARQQAKTPIENVIEALELAGYKVTPDWPGWRIREPLGGKIRLSADDDLLEYAKGRIHNTKKSR